MMNFYIIIHFASLRWRKREGTGIGDFIENGEDLWEQEHIFDNQRKTVSLQVPLTKILAGQFIAYVNTTSIIASL